MTMDRQTIIDLLSAFGEQEAGQPWCDYSGCGFTEADAPLLAALVADERLSDADAEGNEVWIPLHAWRALLPLMPAGLQELLPALQVLDEDDWANVELPKVIAAAGVVAIEPLQAFLQDDAHTEFARGTAVDALAEVARRDAGLWEQVLAVLVERLQVSAEDDAWVNGCIVSALIDLEAVETVEVIREAYALNKVDMSFCGDMEEVEIALSLRVERDTPRSDYGWFRDDEDFPPPSLEPVAKDMSIDEWEERILQFLNFYSTDASLESLTELHGFFTAIGCSPEPVRPSEWLPEIWGGEELAPEWPDTQSLQVFLALIMPLHNSVMEELQRMDYFAIPFTKGEVEGEKITEFDGWCRGFVVGSQVGYSPLMDVPGVAPLLDVLEDTADNELHTWGVPTAEAIFQERYLNELVRKIYRLGRGERVTTQPPLVHTAPKAGRNDPCPCGSGKKYKKCCLH